MRPVARRAIPALAFAVSAIVRLAAWEPPAEPPRLRQSYMTAVFVPSFGLLGDSSFPLTDYFNVEGGWVNLFPRGDNLNFYFGLEHSLKEYSVFPADTGEAESFDLAEQARDSVYGKATYVFLDFLQLDLGAEYFQNRRVSAAVGYEDYDFDRLTFSQGLAWDLRYSSIENYYRGKNLLFPQEGFRTELGLREHLNLPVDGASSWSPQAYGEAQLLLHPGRFWVLSLDVSGEANLDQGSPRAQSATSKVLGAFEAAGDYAFDAFAELRFLHGAGLFWDSPEFWYISSFLFKFSPGFALGYDIGTVGRYGAKTPVVQQSGYISPLVAMRMNGELVTVVRVDLAFSSSGLYKIVLSLSIGTVGGGKSSPLVKSGIR